MNLNLSAIKNGTKNKSVAGIPTIILFANKTVFPGSCPCTLDIAKTIKVEIGSETINPPKIGLVFEIHKTSVRIPEVKNKFKSKPDMAKDPYIEKSNT